MKIKASCLFAILFTFECSTIFAQPTGTADGVRFQIDAPQAISVVLIGDFNGWSKTSDPLTKDSQGKWIGTKKLKPGTYQYAFLVDGTKILTDPANDVTFQDIQRQRANSIVTVTADGGVVLQGYPERQRLNDVYPKTGGTVYLNLIWRYHQPSYYDAEKDQIQTPLVRIHATKDYYDMAANVQKQPSVHVTAALSPSLLWQIENIYVRRMEPFVRTKNRHSSFEANSFQSRFRGKTDPWIDLCLKSAGQFNDDDKATLYKSPWGVFSISPVQMSRFPQLNALYEKWKDAQGSPTFTEQEIRSLKFWAIFANFDPEFYERKIPLPNKVDVDFRDLVSFRADGRYYLKNEVSEEDCQRIILDVYKVMSSIVPEYQKIKYNPRARSGQIEIAGTLFFNAPLPLLINSDVAKDAMSNATLPKPYNHPEDAEAQIQQSLNAYNEYFEYKPRGYVPAAGMISPADIPLLLKNGYSWFTSDQSILSKSEPPNQSINSLYVINEKNEKIAASFGDNDLTNRVYYTYRNYYAENAADDFVKYVLSFAPENPMEEKLVTVVIDGETPWEWYRNDIDGQGFINGLYRKLAAIFKSRAIITATLSEYIDGNRERGIKPHPVNAFTHISALASGSKINGNFGAWIGETSQNTAWTYINQLRNDLQAAGITPPTSDIYALREGSKEWFAAQAYMSLYAAQGSDWFRSFGKESALQTNPKPYETIFLSHLRNAYSLAQRSGASISAPAFAPFVSTDQSFAEWTKPKQKTRVTFHCQLKDREAITAVYIAGNRPELADMQPNIKRMWDNAEHGDDKAGDNIWTLVVDLDQGPLQYKFTNSGGEGTWEGSEAFPEVWRHLDIVGEKMTIDDVFGNLKK